MVLATFWVIFSKNPHLVNLDATKFAAIKFRGRSSQKLKNKQC
jgi:hypothetical protein